MLPTSESTRLPISISNREPLMAKLLDGKVAVFARNAEALQDLAVRAPDQVLAVPGDVTVRADLERLVTATVKRFGGVDVVVPNAGVAKVVSFADSCATTISMSGGRQLPCPAACGSVSRSVRVPLDVLRLERRLEPPDRFW